MCAVTVAARAVRSKASMGWFAGHWILMTLILVMRPVPSALRDPDFYSTPSRNRSSQWIV